MRKPLVIVIVPLAVIIVCLVYAMGLSRSSLAPVIIQTASSPRDATYTIDGHLVTLKDGVSDIEAAPGSASRIITRYFGNEVAHDFDGDGRIDSAFIIDQSTGGTGTFYYVVVALNTATGYVGSEGFLLGDRIAPQTVEMGKGNVIVANYADRKPGESFTVQPSVGKSVWLLLDPKAMRFGEVAQNFEGEADVTKMSLGMQTWNWIGTIYSNGSSTTPKVPGKFTITFKTDNTFSATTDCNSVGGQYTVKQSSLVFGQMMSTEMYCEGSQEDDFTKALGEARSYHFTSKGELVLDLGFDSGAMMFR